MQILKRPEALLLLCPSRAWARGGSSVWSVGGLPKGTLNAALESAIQQQQLSNTHPDLLLLLPYVGFLLVQFRCLYTAGAAATKMAVRFGELGFACLLLLPDSSPLRAAGGSFLAVSFVLLLLPPLLLLLHVAPVTTTELVGDATRLLPGHALGL